jgi:hypothetical protein
VSINPVQPFSIAIPQGTLVDLDERLAGSRWPAGHLEWAEWRDGPEPAYLRSLVAYWQRESDWRMQERALNRFDQVRVDLDGIAVHAIHQRGRGPRPLPLVLTHGWRARSRSFGTWLGR